MNKINLEYDTQVSMVWYESLDAGSFKQFSQPKWSELVNRLAIPQINNNKYSHGVAVYGDLADSDKGKKYRADNNVIYRDVLVLDYDDVSDLKALNEAFKAHLGAFAYFWHTSYNHHTEAPRLRLFIPLNKRINGENYRKYTKVIASKIGHKVDEGLYQPSRAMALPVIKDKSRAFMYRCNDAPILDCPTIEGWVNEIKQEDKPITVSYKAKRDSAYWRDIAFGVSEGERNQTLASLIGYLLRRYVDQYLVYGLASAWAMTCTPPIEQKEVNKTFESILKRDNQNKKGVSD
ncbi:primase alpha helix C-terminal domain-containing protein [Staphylococcus simulans]|uniref:primase alpha helix C-terminal domain-containing protein n=1 Tax=Staphylococcus simulans TaxID=1286 RepID=UPI0028A497B4|nr:primase alpha helix C-terminal domain-containing protein [Staphylococcus simulans]MDT4011850.1 primase alpha helix C-terminal domain-containing protein [Staphylococcus simulans]